MRREGDGRSARKCVFVIGPEGSGSKLAARICAELLGIHAFDDWDGSGCCEAEVGKVLHRSLPFGDPPRFPDIAEWISQHQDEWELFFILTTRDRTLSEYSRVSRFPKSPARVRAESDQARAVMVDVMRGGQSYLIWSYETFMFLGPAYLDELRRFLGVERELRPKLVDGNAARISGGWIGWLHRMHSRGQRYAAAFRGRLSR